MGRRAERNRCAGTAADGLHRRSCRPRRSNSCTPVGKQRPYARTEWRRWRTQRSTEQNKLKTFRYYTAAVSILVFFLGLVAGPPAQALGLALFAEIWRPRKKKL